MANPFALQEMSVLMPETIRKGYWKPERRIIDKLADLQAGLIRGHKPGCSVFVCDNNRLREFVGRRHRHEKAAGLIRRYRERTVAGRARRGPGNPGYRP